MCILVDPVINIRPILKLQQRKKEKTVSVLNESLSVLHKKKAKSDNACMFVCVRVYACMRVCSIDYNEAYLAGWILRSEHIIC